jgi:anti-anti-sigma factor
MTANTIAESPADGVRVVRFLRPDVRPALYDRDAVTDTTLYKELAAGIPDGGTLVLNFGLIDWFPSAFYALLLQLFRDARARGAHLALCCLTANVAEAFELMGGDKLFEVYGTEARAVAAAKKA